MQHEQNLLSSPWHLLVKKRAGTATAPELAELAAWFVRHAPVPAATTAPAAETTPVWQQV